MIKKYYYTIINLKPIQIRYQLWYRIRRYWRELIGFKYPLSIKKDGYPIVLEPFIAKYKSFDNYNFTFLNQCTAFSDNDIDWNYNGFGKLWTYNLNYFDFLLQPEMKPETGLALIEDFISKLKNESTALEPYPIALRGINWIKFISHHCEDDKGGQSNLSEINACLYAQYLILLNNLEYHLLGNHLLEDGFSLLFGAFYFKDEKLYNKATGIIKSELTEQILDDGGHFELSPMYHQIMLDRLLDGINMLQNNEVFFKGQKILLEFMIKKSAEMQQWLNCMTFSNGAIPLLNDSASGIAPTTEQLNEYAINLKVISSESIRAIRLNCCNSYLKESGYRRFNGTNYECIIDIGKIGSSYQSGHAHADTFNFVLLINNNPIIVDTGISTYEANSTRLKERGTAAHNTVTVKDQDSSKVWSSFRVARRATVKIIKEDENLFIAKHNGYRQISTVHERNWYFKENQIQITDTLEGKHNIGKAHFWFEPQLRPSLSGEEILIKKVKLTFENAGQITLIKKRLPAEFNVFKDTYKLEVSFQHHLKTTILPYD